MFFSNKQNLILSDNWHFENLVLKNDTLDAGANVAFKRRENGWERPNRLVWVLNSVDTHQSVNKVYA